MRLDAATECAGENARVNSSKMVLRHSVTELEP